MEYFEIKNPTRNPISIRFEGFDYSVEAMGSSVVPAAVAKYWKERIHNFVSIKKVSDAVVKAVEEEVAVEEVVEVAEEVIEEVIEEAPKAANKKVAKKSVK